MAAPAAPPRRLESLTCPPGPSASGRRTQNIDRDRQCGIARYLLAFANMGHATGFVDPTAPVGHPCTVRTSTGPPSGGGQAGFPSGWGCDDGATGPMPSTYDHPEVAIGTYELSEPARCAITLPDCVCKPVAGPSSREPLGRAVWGAVCPPGAPSRRAGRPLLGWVHTPSNVHPIRRRG